jgi:hypothetical protein
VKEGSVKGEMFVRFLGYSVAGMLALIVARIMGCDDVWAVAAAMLVYSLGTQAVRWATEP